MKSAAIRTRGAKICSPWLNPSAASADKRDTQQFGQPPVFTNTDVADTIKAEMQKILDERPETVLAPPRSRNRLQSVAMQSPAPTAGEPAAVQDSAAAAAGAGFEDASPDTPRRLVGQRCMTISLRPREEKIGGESGKFLVRSRALNKCKLTLQPCSDRCSSSAQGAGAARGTGS